ncbi:MAG: hypothetical protein Q9O74_07550 [Planctomycetota bacterium]|nr:hypothetical protein [Planctomycetota bacterium]
MKADLQPFMLSTALLILAAISSAATACRGPLDFRGASPGELLVTLNADRPDRVFAKSAMANRLLGTVSVVDAIDRRRLANASRRAAETGWPEETDVLGYVHVSRGRDAHSYRIGATPDGLLLFDDLREPRTFAMDMADCEPLLAPLLGFAGDHAVPADVPLGEVVPALRPYRRSPLLLDTATIRDRLSGGRRSNLPETQRYLPDEQFFVRLPVGYSARFPAGLIVWIDASASGRPPEVFNQAADELNCIMVGAADAGNLRLATDRYQLALDMVATMVRRYHINTNRVYVTGISGGGRISSGLVACFPEVFTGAVPIVGLNAYKKVPLGDGRFVVAGFGRPKAASWRLLRTRRIAPMTGPLDFNYREMVNATRIMTSDGLNVRMFEYEDMAHTLPTADRFLEALRWVDAAHAEEAQDAAEDAEKLLAGYVSRYGEVPAENEGQRKLLERVAETAPWSLPGWRACELLGVAAPLPTTDSVPDAGTTDPDSP